MSCISETDYIEADTLEIEEIRLESCSMKQSMKHPRYSNVIFMAKIKIH